MPCENGSKAYCVKRSHALNNNSVGKPYFLLSGPILLALVEDGKGLRLNGLELSPNFGDGLKDQAAAWA